MLKRYLVFIPATLYVNAESEEEALRLTQEFECKAAGLLETKLISEPGVTNGFLNVDRAEVEFFRELHKGL